MRSWPHFSAGELACRCGCGTGDMDDRLMEPLEALRVAVGAPMVVTSAYRCAAHNRAVGGHPSSVHTMGLAVDFLAAGGLAWDVFTMAPGFGFMGVGLQQKGAWEGRYIHLDVFDGDDKRPAIWTY